MNGDLPIIVIGAGGHAKVLLGLLKALDMKVLGLTDANAALHGTNVLGYPVLGGDEIIKAEAPDSVALVLGVGSTRPGTVRRSIHETYTKLGYGFLSCVHPSAWVSQDAEIGQGAQIMAGAIIQPGCRIGENTIINTRASVDHDACIGNHVHIAPGAVLGGSVTIGDGAHIGTGASVIETRTIGVDALVAAGACVIQDVPDGRKVAGVPAEEF